jgi:hypothetical protein
LINTYCNAKRCGKYKSCKKHICNITTIDLVNITDYSVQDCLKDHNYPLYESLSCKNCGENKTIFANDMCKYCYNKTKIEEGAWNLKNTESKYIPTGKPRGKQPDKEKISQIIDLRKQGKTFKEIGTIVGLSRQRVKQIYDKYTIQQK